MVQFDGNSLDDVVHSDQRDVRCSVSRFGLFNFLRLVVRLFDSVYGNRTFGFFPFENEMHP